MWDLWTSLATPPGWTDMEYQLQDWFNFFWLSCDLPGLNLVHDLDKGAWAMRDEPPVRCWGMGGRQTRVGPQYGDVWDHHSVVFEYANGTRMYAYCRQQDGCVPDISDRFFGTKGRCDLLNYRIDGEKPWRYGKGPITIKEIADRQGISFSYLEQLLHKLGKAGVIESVRGPAGGYLLARKPSDLTIGDIVRTLEGPIALSHCLEPGEYEECSQTDDCVARMVWAQVGAKIEEALDSITFDDLLRQQPELKAALLKPGRKAAMTGKGVC